MWRRATAAAFPATTNRFHFLPANLTPVFLPPYSPELNAIDACAADGGGLAVRRAVDQFQACAHEALGGELKVGVGGGGVYLLPVSRRTRPPHQYWVRSARTLRWRDDSSDREELRLLGTESLIL